MSDFTPLMQQLRQLSYSRYMLLMLAPQHARLRLLALFSLDLELAQIPSKVSEEMLGHIRYTWWRESFDLLEKGEVRQHPVVELWHSVIAPPLGGSSREQAHQGEAQDVGGKHTSENNPSRLASVVSLPGASTLPQGEGYDAAIQLVNIHTQHFEQQPTSSAKQMLDHTDAFILEQASAVMQSIAPKHQPKWQRKLAIITRYQEKGGCKPGNIGLMVRLLAG